MQPACPLLSSMVTINVHPQVYVLASWLRRVARDSFFDIAVELHPNVWLESSHVNSGV